MSNVPDPDVTRLEANQAAGRERRAAAACEYPEGHEEHLRVNGECPWCGAADGGEER